MVFPDEQNFLIEMKQTLLSLAVIFFGLGSAFGQTTLDLELNGTSSDLDPFMFGMFRHEKTHTVGDVGLFVL